MNSIGIINCGLGNLTSVVNAFNSAGAHCDVINKQEEINDYDKIVLPGVGAFAAFMQQLNQRKFVPAIKKHIASQKPIMGICLGMQIFFEESQEFENANGLGVLKGKVISLPKGKYPVPNVGWWNVRGNFNSFSEEISEEDTFYFVHTYCCLSEDDYDGLYIEFNGAKVLVSVRLGNIFGYQFHPEKSQKSGQKLIRAFSSI